MSFMRGIGDPAGDDRAGTTPAHEEQRRALRRNILGTGTLACPRCDAPVALGGHPIDAVAHLACPFCGHHGRAREFLSMRQPTRPNRVTVTFTVRRS